MIHPSEMLLVVLCSSVMVMMVWIRLVWKAMRNLWSTLARGAMHP